MMWLLAVLATLHLVNGGYVITTPRRWFMGENTQMCVFVDDPAAPEGSLTFNITKVEYRDADNVNVSVLVNNTIQFPAGKTEACKDIAVQVDGSYHHSTTLRMSGNLNGVDFYHEGRISLQRNDAGNVFIQTDKYRYLPGQKVQFRILTVTGPRLSIDYENYKEIWVRTPSRTRIAQWKNVDNSKGLVHLEMQLADEPEEGNYNIYVKTSKDTTSSTSFKVEEYVLPRYEVTVKPVKYFLATDENFAFTVCARYTYGEPVKGNVTLSVNNGQSRKCLVDVIRKETISGCKEFEFLASDMKITDCNVYTLRASATVTEAGTGVELEAGGSLSVTRRAVNFRTIYKDEYMKPNLPYTLKVRAELPDGSPASGVPMEVCAAGRCNNMTSAVDGLFTTLLPSYDANRVVMKTLNCRADMQASSFNSDLEHYYSPSNSSLLIHAPDEHLKCVPGKVQVHVLPVFFSASADQNKAEITLQVVSRGQIQHWSIKEYTFTAGDLPINVEDLVEPLPPSPPNTVRGVINIPVTLPPTASPRVRVLVWYTRADGEVVSDTRELTVDKCLGHNVSLTWSAEKVQPGDDAVLDLSSAPNSICSLGIVDRSTELLSSRGDSLTLDKLFGQARRYDIPSWVQSQVDDYTYCENKEVAKQQAAAEAAQGEIRPIAIRSYGYYSDYVDAIHMFDDSGLLVFSDSTLETRPCEKEEHRFVAFRPPAVASAGFGGGDSPQQGGIAFRPQSSFEDSNNFSNKEQTTTETSEPRTEFPETWLWDIVVVPSAGVQSLPVSVPDTITEWVGKAVCASSQAGVGVSERASLITFTPFFVDLTLPPSMKRGEILPIKISVFNYLNESLPVTIKVEESAEYEILESAADAGLGERRACIPSQDKVVQTVRVNPLVLGDVNLTVSAYVDPQNVPGCASSSNTISRRDSLIKPIKVDPEGFPREKTWSKYICTKANTLVIRCCLQPLAYTLKRGHSNVWMENHIKSDFEDGSDSLEAWDISPPAVIVEGSDRGWVTAVGDLLALTLENLGHLIRMPYGCGEQNMLNFAPNIFIMQYLEASQQITPESREKLLRFMNTGYQRELLYRRNNGSYSAFGNADDSGSTWLTAFVLKSFAQAQKYILIDEEGLNQTRSWLKTNQGSDGCFKHVGKVLHKGMKGGIAGSNSSVSLTAYVLVSLLEAGEDKTNSSVIEAAKCLQADTSQDAYTLALKTYALVLAGLPKAQESLDRLLELAIVAKNSTHWEASDSKGRTNQALAMETTAYGLLAMMSLDATAYEQQARKIVKWITSQRNGQGGFFSTQDTVVALQALATYEMHTYQGPLDVSATVTADGLKHVFIVNEDNKLLQQMEILPRFPTTVSITMTGQGCAVIQAVLRYNIPEPEGSDAFELTVNTRTVTDKDCVTKRITACASYHLPDEVSNMAVIEVNLISGYIPEKEDLKALVRENPKIIKRYEVDGSKINFYIEELTRNSTCVNFRAIREVTMENLKPGSVVVYDYYQPQLSISQSYTFPPPEECR